MAEETDTEWNSEDETESTCGSFEVEECDICVNTGLIDVRDTVEDCPVCDGNGWVRK